MLPRSTPPCPSRAPLRRASLPSPRGELTADEDPSGLSPGYLRKRTPQLAMVALFAILDPPREEAIEAAKVAHEAGITVKMITGGWGRGRLS